MGESLVLIPVFYDLVKSTKKYTNIDENIVYTDFWITPANTILPILKENNVDMSNLIKTINYAKKRWETIDSYYDEIITTF